MKNLDKTVLAKGIFYNKKTRLCIFETEINNKIKWFNVHIDNIEGKFFQGCQANLYQYNGEIVKAVIIESAKKGKKSSIPFNFNNIF